jgi:hypothetical protein
VPPDALGSAGDDRGAARKPSHAASPFRQPAGQTSRSPRAACLTVVRLGGPTSAASINVNNVDDFCGEVNDFCPGRKGVTLCFLNHFSKWDI